MAANHAFSWQPRRVSRRSAWTRGVWGRRRLDAGAVADTDQSLRHHDFVERRLPRRGR